MKEIMSWLFKDPISLAQFDHAQSNSKNWPNSSLPHNQIAPNDFFLSKNN